MKTLRIYFLETPRVRGFIEACKKYLPLKSGLEFININPPPITNIFGEEELPAPVKAKKGSALIIPSYMGIQTPPLIEDFLKRNKASIEYLLGYGRALYRCNIYLKRKILWTISERSSEDEVLEFWVSLTFKGRIR